VNPVIAFFVATLLLATQAQARGYEEHLAVGHPKGTVIVVHGGSWSLVGPGQVQYLRPVARRFAAAGYEVFNIDYRAGRRSAADVLARYRQIRATHSRVCLYGESAGAHLAMLAAERAGNAACVIAMAGPTDLPTLGGSPSRDAALASARHAFGGALARFSPLRRAWPRRTPLTLVYARHDPLVDFSQGRRMARHAHARLIALDGGSAPFVHSSVDAAQRSRAYATVLARLRQAMAATKPAKR
jgi:acetyl esterase/lipase